MGSNISAIIFDCFGVLVRDGWLPFKERYFAHDADLLQSATDLNKQVDAGLIDYQDFIADVAELAGIPAEQAHLEIEQNPPNDELFTAIANYKVDYKIGLLSNAGANWLADLFKPEQLSLFDATVLSCDIGVLKPDVRAYQAIAEKLGVETAECLFIDDQLGYCQGARDAGMTAVHYQSNAQLFTDLAAVLAGSQQ